MFHILLIDDEEHVINALTRCLRRAFQGNIKIESFTVPHDALKRAAETGFDVVVSDYRMPDMDGVTLLTKIAEIQPSTVRLILSATEDFSVLMKAVNEAGISRFISKPWEEAVFVDIIRHSAENAQQHRNERLLADERRLEIQAISPQELERRRLEEEEPGLTHVKWGPGGEVLLDDDLN